MTSCFLRGLIVVILTTALISPSTAQEFLPGLNVFRNYESFPVNIPTFYEGNLELAPIFIDGKVVGFVSSKIGLEPKIPDADVRAALIHRKLQGILEQMSAYSQNYQSTHEQVKPEQLEQIIADQLKIIASKERCFFKKSILSLKYIIDISSADG